MKPQKKTILIPGRKPTCCDIQILEDTDSHQHTIVMTERDDNPGLSITNSSERIATALVNENKWAPADCRWVEHYATTPSRPAPVTWDLVIYTWGLRSGVWVASFPVWSPLIPEDVKRLAADLGFLSAEENEDQDVNNIAERMLEDAGT